MMKKHNGRQEYPHKLLVIADDLAMRALLEDMLRCRGYEVYGGPAEQHTQQPLQPDQIREVLAHITIPTTAGLPFLQVLNVSPTTLMVVILTSVSNGQTAKTSDQEGATQVSPKPVGSDRRTRVRHTHSQTPYPVGALTSATPVKKTGSHIAAPMPDNPLRAPMAGGLLQPSSRNLFRQEGEYWTLAYAGTLIRLRDVKGLHDLVALLRHPGQSIHVLDLVAATETRTAAAHGRLYEGMGNQQLLADHLRLRRLSDAGPKLDRRAKAAYKHRLDDLRDALAEAQRNHDPVRVAGIQMEIHSLTTTLASAYGLGGRVRTSGDIGEKARKAVTNRIKHVLAKLQDANPPLWRHLSNSVKTGAFCVYAPEQATLWQF